LREVNYHCQACGEPLSERCNLYVLEDDAGGRAMVCKRCVVFVAGAELGALPDGVCEVNMVIAEGCGDIFWYNPDGLLHRKDGPAATYADGVKHWRSNGKLHRLDGPAIEDADGSKLWYRHGKQHREDGPAVERANGGKEWWVRGLLHREDGPAIEPTNGRKTWCLDGFVITKKRWEKERRK
jgi:DNA-directed RNA polymerase subunit RPC12/RpoP